MQEHSCTMLLRFTIQRHTAVQASLLVSKLKGARRNLAPARKLQEHKCPLVTFLPKMQEQGCTLLLSISNLINLSKQNIL